MTSTAAATPNNILLGTTQANNGYPLITFDAVDWTDRDSIIKLFPSYFQAQYINKKTSGKPLPKGIDIEYFTMKTPFGDKTLIKNTPLKLEANKKLALIGENGVGKSLLFANMVNGSIKGIPPHIHIHHCKEFEQEEINTPYSVKESVLRSHPYMSILRNCEKKLQSLLDDDDEKDKESKDSKESKGELGESEREKIGANLDWVKFSLNSIHSGNAEERVEKMLRVLGFDDHGQKKLLSELSGGLKMRVALAMAFFIDSDFLLLDEPGNHLDYPSLLWLENRLRAFKGSFLLVSHDRELLGNVCQTVLLLEDITIKYYMCGFKEFEKRKAAEDQKKYEEIEKFLAKNPNPDPSTMLGRDRAEKKLWYDTYFAKQVALQGKFTFGKFSPLPRDNKLQDSSSPATDPTILIKMDQVRFSYQPAAADPVYIFNTPVTINITTATRLAALGPNGAGKSTWLKLITQKLIPVSGTVQHHQSMSIAYFGQHSTAELDLEMTPIEFMQREFPNESTGTLRNHLAKSSVAGATQDTRMMRLSFSQRSCIIFSKLTLQPSALLIMDEPTNFLDLSSVDSLIGACKKYPGALLLVSHNRDFLRKCANSYLSIVPGKFQLFDDLKTAERATYTFIAEMEEGGGAGAIGKNALSNNPGGGSVAAFQGAPSTSSSPTPAVAAAAAVVAAPVVAAAPAAPAKIETYAEKEKCQAKWTDGKFYAAIVKKVLPGDKYAVTYTQYGNTTTVHASVLKKEAKAAPAAAKK